MSGKTYRWTINGLWGSPGVQQGESWPGWLYRPPPDQRTASPIRSGQKGRLRMRPSWHHRHTSTMRPCWRTPVSRGANLTWRRSRHWRRAATDQWHGWTRLPKGLVDSAVRSSMELGGQCKSRGQGAGWYSGRETNPRAKGKTMWEIKRGPIRSPQSTHPW